MEEEDNYTYIYNEEYEELIKKSIEEQKEFINEKKTPNMYIEYENQYGDSNENLLTKYCANGNFEMAKYLIDLGSNVNETFISWSVGQSAICGGNIEIFKYLIKNGLIINKISLSSLIVSAMICNNFDMFKLLIEHDYSKYAYLDVYNYSKRKELNLSENFKEFLENLDKREFSKNLNKGEIDNSDVQIVNIENLTYNGSKKNNNKEFYLNQKLLCKIINETFSEEKEEEFKEILSEELQIKKIDLLFKEKKEFILIIDVFNILSEKDFDNLKKELEKNFKIVEKLPKLYGGYLENY